MVLIIILVLKKREKAMLFKDALQFLLFESLTTVQKTHLI